MSEWLYSYPSRRRRTLFERESGSDPEITFGRTLVGQKATMSKLLRPTALFLSVAANNNHPALTRVYHEFRKHFRYARFNESDKQLRIRMVTDLISNETIARQAQALLKFADLGIAGVDVKEEELSNYFRSTIERVISAVHGENAEGSDDQQNDKMVDKAIDDLRKQMRFLHAGESADGALYNLGMKDQSAGTIAWLSIGVPALVSLRNGDVFMVDELDSSLHPRLTVTLIQMFKDPEINPSGAQLVFTSHDASLLGTMLGNVLNRDEIWFTEKQQDGATDLYALQEFTTRKSDNFELRYLQGRYGAIPIIDHEELRAALVVQET